MKREFASFNEEHSICTCFLWLVEEVWLYLGAVEEWSDHEGKGDDGEAVQKHYQKYQKDVAGWKDLSKFQKDCDNQRRDRQKNTVNDSPSQPAIIQTQL